MLVSSTISSKLFARDLYLFDRAKSMSSDLELLRCCPEKLATCRQGIGHDDGSFRQADMTTGLANDRSNNHREKVQLSIRPDSSFAFQSLDACRSSNASLDRYIPCRKTSTIMSKVVLPEENCKSSFDNTLLSKYRKRVLGLEPFVNSLRFSRSPSKEFSSIKDFLQDTKLSEAQDSHRTIPKSPYKVLDAPMLDDDFYLNLIDWSPSNLLCVGLTTYVYMWSSQNSKITKLCNMQSKITSVSCSSHTNDVAVSSGNGRLHVYDSIKTKLVWELEGARKDRTATLSWSSKLLAGGSADKNIYIYDSRCQTKSCRKMVGHRQEVCGVKWSYDEQQLASGGNDNKLMIWDMRMDLPLYKFNHHQAAVKALSWSPHQHGLLASGGGAKDRTIKFWNTIEGFQTMSVDTHSQVCNLLFSKNSNQLVSTHGYIHNQIMLWRTKNLQHFDTLVGHNMRVLYIALSPDGKTIVTGSGDETLRFWEIFPESDTAKAQPSKLLTLEAHSLR